MIDFHTHTLWSDGELTPAEHVRRASIAGYKVIGITDHADSSNIEILCKESIQFSKTINNLQNDIFVLSGVELTHVLPEEILDLSEFAKKNGVDLVIVHGETIVEPVKNGTNLAAIKAFKYVDILAHPGLISEEEMELAAKNNLLIEITSKKGHSLSNGYVAKLAKKYGAKLVINTDSHTYNDFITKEFATKVLIGAGIEKNECEIIFNNSIEFIKKIKNK